MKASQLVEKFLKNWQVKIICFILAIILYIFHQTSLYDTRSFVIPVNVIQNGIVMPVGSYPKNVTITVRANTESVSLVHGNQFSAYINLDGITKNGEYSIPVGVTLAPEIMQYDPFEVKVKPELIKINVEKKEVAFAKINPSIVGEPAHGYEIKEIQIEPNFVQISGPESIINEIEEINTEKIDLTNANASLNFSVNGIGVNKIMEIDNPGPYDVKVKIEPSVMEKSFNNYKVQPINLSNDFKLIKETPYVNLTLQGIVPLLETFNLNAYSVQVDLSSIKQAGRYELPVKFVYPSYFTLVSKSLDKVVIEVEKIIIEEPEETEASEETEEKSEETQAKVEAAL